MQGNPVQVFSEVEKLQELGLDVPLAAQIVYKLRKKGIDIPQNIITDKALVEALCQYN